MAETIAPATSDVDFADFAALVRDYVEWSRHRYAGDAWFMDAAFGHQALDAELAEGFPAYRPPGGCTLLAKRDRRTLGGVAYRRLSDEACEMKRLFVRAEGQGRGLGRRLCLALMEAARISGYRVMRLDTADLFGEAIALYRTVGFRDCPPFHAYPETISPRIVFMERPLSDP
ncbi:MAG: GNAT family N-acetyltransferase [Mesorhizobium sp.]|jgi:putative acetyltransferase